MKRVFLVMAIVTTGMLMAAPSIRNVAVFQDPSTGRIAVDYTLMSEAAVVTVDLEEEVDGEWRHFDLGEASLFGDANRFIPSVGAKHAYCYPPRRGKLKTGSLRAKVIAWPISSPAIYMSINLSITNDVCYYASADSIPGGLTNDIYRVSKILMRKIPARGVSFKQGDLVGANEHKGYYTNFNAVTKATLSQDYYMAIYELTQGQFIRARAPNPYANISSCYTNAFGVLLKNWELRAADYSTTVIGGIRASDSIAVWPRNGHAVSPTSAIQGLRKVAGDRVIDFPTDAQWDYAARAGCGGYIYGGLSNTQEDYDKIAWDKTNGMADPDVERNSEHHRVGQKLPNDWGIYDILGNVRELVLEGGLYYPAQAGSGVVTDPTCVAGVSSFEVKTTLYGESARPYLMTRGGSVVDGKMSINSRIAYTSWNSLMNIGMRLVCPAEVP